MADARRAESREGTGAAGVASEGAAAGAASEGAAAGVADPRSLARWTFTSFHVAVLVALGVTAAHALGAVGDLLGGLDTTVGFALYLVLWGVTWVTNGRWLASADPWPVEVGDRRTIIAAGAAWGAITGFALFALLLVAVSIVVLPSAPFVVVAFFAGTIAAIVIGSVVGGALAAVDVLLVGLLWPPQN